MVKRDQALTVEDASRLARQWLNDVLERAEHAYAGAGVKSSDLLTMRRGQGEENEKTWAAMLAANDLAIAEGPARKLLEDAGISIPADATIFADLCRKVLRATIEGSRVLRARLEGRYDYVAQDPLFQNLQSAPDHRPASPAKKQGPRLSDLIKSHVSSGKRTWTSQTLHQNEATFSLFKDFVSDPFVGSIDRGDISAFVEALARLPKRYGQIPVYRQKTLVQMCEVAKSQDLELARVSQKTLNRHASALSGLFTWAKKHGEWEGENPAQGFIDKKAVKRSQRRPWRREELIKLFSSPPWKGCRSKFHRLTPGEHIIRDGHFFIPLMALYSGAREAELCKLAAEDFRQVDDLWVFDVTDSELGRVKENASLRTVPVHPELIRLGIIEHVRGVLAKGGGHLWSDLKRSRFGNTYARNFSKWFGTAKQKAGITDPNVVFHSFRHSVASHLHGAGVLETTVTDILGHEHQSMSLRVYSQGATARVLYDAICKLDYQLKLPHL